MQPVLLDTDILSEVMKQKDANVLKHASGYLRSFSHFSFSSMTRYEVVRGLHEKNAVKQHQQFLAFCQHSKVVPISDDILDRAAGLWVLARKNGWPNRDADMIIAAPALEHGFALGTGNSHHFSWIPGLTIVDWRQP